MDHRVKDLATARAGASKIEWAGAEMPVLNGISGRFAREQPLAGLRISACLHVTAETANSHVDPGSRRCSGSTVRQQSTVNTG